MIDIATSTTLVRYRFRYRDLAPWLAAVTAFYFFPDYLVFGTSVLVMVIFALSLDLVIGFAGILTLGHGVFYGIGAYAAGLITLAGWREAISGALFGGAVATAFALITAPIVLRLRGLPLIMVTLGLASIVAEAANKASWLTGGHDGLQGITIAPLFGAFDWSLTGDTSYLYALAWLAVLFLLLRVIVCSPFGVALQGIRENVARMRVIGAPVLAQMVLAYAISAGLAGIAGALSAQTNAFVSLEVLNLDLSLYALAMLVLGGIGELYGAMLGAVVYMAVQYFAQQWDPYYWMFAIGFLLILVVRAGGGGLIALFSSAKRQLVLSRARGP